MDAASPSTSVRTSGIPRFSRLPVPQAIPSLSTLKPSPSREKLAADPGVVVSRLRNAPSQDSLRSSTASRQNITSKPKSVGVQAPKAGRKTSTTKLAAKEIRDDHIFKKPFARPPSRQHGDSRPQSQQSSDLPSPLQTSGPFGDKQEERDVSSDAGLSTPSERKSRPSLSDRTIETLAQIPPSPSPRRRKSSFYVAESPKRPGSAMSRASRPNSSVGNYGIQQHTDSATSARTKLVARQTKEEEGIINAQSVGRDGTGIKSIKSTIKSNGGLTIPKNLADAESTDRGGQATPKPKVRASNVSSAAKTYSGRSAKPRTSLQDSFRGSTSLTTNPSSKTRPVSNSDKGASALSSTPSRPTAARASKSVKSQSQSAFRKASDLTKEPRKVSSSSSTLRETIAKAKAARKSSGHQQLPKDRNYETPVTSEASFDFDLPSDPFNQNQDPTGNKGLLRKRVEAARIDGKLNIAAMRLKEIPEAVLKMYDLESTDTTNGAWYESVDLTKFIAADNEIEVLDDKIFPDISPEDLAEQEDTSGSQFGGLESLDLRGNLLDSLPLGLRRLERLTSLNLSNNKLGTSVFDVVVQIPSLRELRLSKNQIGGSIPDSIGSLEALEILDLHENMITDLPEGLQKSTSLSLLNVASNQLREIPLNRLGSLKELLASKNKLSGSLFPPTVNSMPKLQTLDIMANAITDLNGQAKLSLPALKLLVITANRVTHLPDVSTWQELLTLAAEDNKIRTLPEGFISLKKIRHADFTGNDFKTIDEHVADMESLEVLRLSNNPLREKKFLSMTTDDIKRDLRARLPANEDASDTHDTEEQSSAAVAGSTTTSSSSLVKRGVLDLSNKQLLTLSVSHLSEIASECTVTTIEAHHNSFGSFPTQVSVFSGTLTSLNLSHNNLQTENLFLEPLVLPMLQNLNISSNSLKNLDSLVTNFKSPLLNVIDISFNRILVLPKLRDHFPALQTVLASDNSIQDLPVEAVRGLHVCDVSRNDIGHLNPRLGLLGMDGGLRRLEVQGNKFRVPRWTVVEKGTDVLLSWLKDKIPVGEEEDELD